MCALKTILANKHNPQEKQNSTTSTPKENKVNSNNKQSHSKKGLVRCTECKVHNENDNISILSGQRLVLECLLVLSQQIKVNLLVNGLQLSESHRFQCLVLLFPNNCEKYLTVYKRDNSRF